MEFFINTDAMPPLISHSVSGSPNSIKKEKEKERISVAIGSAPMGHVKHAEDWALPSQTPQTVGLRKSPEINLFILSDDFDAIDLRILGVLAPGAESK